MWQESCQRESLSGDSLARGSQSREREPVSREAVTWPALLPEAFTRATLCQDRHLHGHSVIGNNPKGGNPVWSRVERA